MGYRATKAGNKSPSTEEPGREHRTPTWLSAAHCQQQPPTAKLTSKRGIAGGRYADDCFYHGPAGTVPTTGAISKRSSKKQDLSCKHKKSAAYTPRIEDLNEDERKGPHRMLEIVPRADHPTAGTWHHSTKSTLGDDQRL